MQSDLTNLDSNLTNIYLALNPPVKQPLACTANGRIFCPSASWWSTIEMWANQAVSFFAHQTADLSNALKKTLNDDFNLAARECYQARIGRVRFLINENREENLTPDLIKKLFKLYLKRDLPDIPKKERLFFEAIFHDTDSANWPPMRVLRANVLSFHEATRLFWLFIWKEKEEKQEHFFLNAYVEPESALFSKPYCKALKKEGDWVSLESVLYKETPFNALLKINSFESLANKEKNELKNWAQAICSKQELFSSQLVICVLEEVVRMVQLLGRTSPDLLDLVIWLNDQGYENLLNDCDAKQLKWRDRVQEKKFFRCNGVSFSLGKELRNKKKKGIDHFQYFEIEGYPDYLVEIPNHRFRSIIKARQSDDPIKHWGIDLVAVIKQVYHEASKQSISGLDNSGKCAIVEKLYDTFENHVWTSTSYKLDNEDEELVLIFANHIYHAYHNDGFFNCSFKDIGRAKDGSFKAFHFLKKQEGHYDKWEKRCVKLSKKNPFILSALMHVSRLSLHPVAQFYREEVKIALENEKKILRADTNLHYENKKDDYYDKGDKLRKNARKLREKLREECVETLKLWKLDNPTQKKFQTQVSQEIAHYYNMQPLAGQFPKSIAKLAKKALKQWVKSLSAPQLTLNNDAKSHQSELEYYDNLFKRMLQYNERAKTMKTHVK